MDEFARQILSGKPDFDTVEKARQQALAIACQLSPDSHGRRVIINPNALVMALQSSRAVYYQVVSRYADGPNQRLRLPRHNTRMREMLDCLVQSGDERFTQRRTKTTANAAILKRASGQFCRMIKSNTPEAT